jgi:isopenicillin N synthase-like dioxygenase
MPAVESRARREHKSGFPFLRGTWTASGYSAIKNSGRSGSVSTEDFGEYLRNEWMIGRADAMYKELWDVLSKLGQQRTAKRQQAILESSMSTPVPGVGSEMEMVARLFTAHTQAMAENVLLAVAIYLAKHEQPPPAE